MSLKISLLTVLIAAALIHSNFAMAQTPPKTISGPFGSKPIQLSIGSDGIKRKEGPGYNCELKASLGDAHYSAWGETEEDARSLVAKSCSDKSGLLLCKKSNATCQQEK